MIGTISAQPSKSPQPQWTLLFYLNGDNNLREEVTRDLVRLHEEGTSADVTAVASLYRGDWRWSMKNVGRKVYQLMKERDMPVQVESDWRGRRTFVVRNADQAGSKTEMLEGKAPGEARVSDWRELRDCLIENFQKFPAQHYALTVATHAVGDGILVDGDGEAMPYAEFGRALTEAQQVTGKRLEVLTLESCQSGQASVVDQLKGVADYLIASPQKISANKAPYEKLLAEIKQRPTMTGAELAQCTQETFAPHLPGFSLYKL